jgi:hypothetical protein
MASFADARAKSQDIAVKTVQAPGVVDTAAASAVQAFGQIAGDARKGALRKDLRQEIEEEAVIVGTLNAPETVVTETGVDISQSDPTGVIDRQSEKFKRLALARQQGKIDDNTIAIEAEKSLREAIAKAPGFADEFRRIASDLVGFDVSGAGARTLFGTGQGGSTRLTALQKAREEAALLAAGGKIDFDDAFQLIVDGKTQELQDASLDSRLKRNKIGAAKAAFLYSADLEKQYLGILSGFADQITETGGIVDIDEFNSNVRRQHRIFLARARQATVRDGIPDIDSQKIIAAELQTTMEAWLAIGQDVDLQKILARDRDVLTNAIAIQGIRVAPTIKLLNETGGQRAVEEYFSLLKVANGNPQVLADFKKKFPSFAFMADVANEAGGEQMGIMLDSLLSRAGSRIPAQDVPLFNAVAALATNDAALRGDDETFWDGLIGMSDTGQVKQPLSILARTKNAYSKGSAADRAIIRSLYNADLVTVESGAAADLANSPFIVRWDAEDQLFRLVGAGGQSRLEVLRDSDLREGSANTADNQMEFLNSYLLNLAKDPAFQADAGIENLDVWATQQAGLINVQADEIRNPGKRELTERLGARVEDGAFEREDGSLVSVVGGEVKVVDLPRVTKTPTVSPTATPENLEIVNRIAKELGIQPEIAVALAQQESSFDPNAESGKGAQGLFQLMPSVQEQFGVLDPNDPEESARAGLQFLSQLQGTFGRLDHALAAFNWGPTNVKRAIRDGKDPLEVAPKETKDFVKNIMSNVGITGDGN